jgi:hypothetical protein
MSPLKVASSYGPPVIKVVPTGQLGEKSMKIETRSTAGSFGVSVTPTYPLESLMKLSPKKDDPLLGNWLAVFCK